MKTAELVDHRLPAIKEFHQALPIGAQVYQILIISLFQNLAGK